MKFRCDDNNNNKKKTLIELNRLKFFPHLRAFSVWFCEINE